MPTKTAKIPVPPNGELKDAELMEVRSSNEPWTEITLADGSVVRTKVVVAEVWRVVGSFTDTGEPVYILRGQPVTITSSPDSIKRKGH